MSNVVIKVEGLSKQYRLGTVGTGTLGHDLNRWWQTSVLRKEDPYLKIGDVNDRAVKGESEYVWALQDINFNVQQGEVLGIIGRNGAGKSTLLKILSRTTSPTTGSVKIKGRVASLLEVGTGFHGELTGRENIFLNGAILGMTKSEIKNKLDEIIDFSGVEKYIDTPVKRYSSGMYVRLAFGVAAHLEPEILIVDEVLAVGDIEFQKKALGKMKAVSEQEGRTVLFVSHNMAAVRKLCTRGLLLINGGVDSIGDTEVMVERYTNNSIEKIERFNFNELIDKNKKIQFINVVLLNKSNVEINTAISGETLKIKFEILNHTESVYRNCSIGIGISNMEDQLMIALKNDLYDIFYDLKPGLNEIICEIPRLPLSGSEYKYNVILNNSSEILDWVKEVGIIEVENGLFFPGAKVPAASRASVLVNHKWHAIIN